MLELDSRNVKALYRRAQAYIHLVDLDLAEMDIKKALEIDPDNRYALVLCSHVVHTNIRYLVLKGQLKKLSQFKI